MAEYNTISETFFLPRGKLNFVTAITVLGLEVRTTEMLLNNGLRATMLFNGIYHSE
jgi:hypothetical protein